MYRVQQNLPPMNLPLQSKPLKRARLNPGGLDQVPRALDLGHLVLVGWVFVLHTSYRGYGCPQCAGVTASSEYNIGRSRPDLASEWNYNRNKIKPEDHTPNSGKKVWWRCALGHEWKAAIDHRNRKGGGIRSGFRSPSP